QAAREDIHKDRLDDAERKLAEVRTMNIRWGLFELDTPTKVAEAIQKARAKQPATPSPSSPAVASRPGNRAAAQVKLREAREALKTSQYDRAEALATEVAGWGLAYSMWEDSPKKVSAA